MAKILTDKQESFCQHYAMHSDGPRAYKAAYDAETVNTAAMRANANKLLRNPAIVLRLAELKKRVIKVADEAFDITAAKVLQELAKIGFANVQDYVKLDDKGIPMPDFSEVTRAQFAAIGEITFEDIEAGQRIGKRVKFKLLDKKGALVDLGKHLGMFTDKSEVKVEHTFIDDAATDFDNRVAQLFARSAAGSDTQRLN
jgi:phage terminase small subunit